MIIFLSEPGREESVSRSGKSVYSLTHFAKVSVGFQDCAGVGKVEFRKIHEESESVCQPAKHQHFPSCGAGSV